MDGETLSNICIAAFLGAAILSSYWGMSAYRDLSEYNLWLQNEMIREYDRGIKEGYEGGYEDGYEEGWDARHQL